MARTKGAINKDKPTIPEAFTMPASDRISLIANLIVDFLIEEQAQAKQKRSTGGEYVAPIN
jgi:hypothetical protein